MTLTFVAICSQIKSHIINLNIMKKILNSIIPFIFIASCGGGGGGGSSPPPAIPGPSISFSATSSSASNGDAVTINWSSTNSSSCTASGGWSGGKSTSGSEDVNISAGENTFTIQCSGDGGTSSESVVIFGFDLGLVSAQMNATEDELYTGSIKASPNETLAQGLTYSIVETTNNGTLLLLDNAVITYNPNLNFNGSDSFTYEAYSPDKNITVSTTIDINVASVNDIPLISLIGTSNLSKNNIIFEDSYSLRVSIGDIDNEVNDLSILASIDGYEIPTAFTLDDGANVAQNGTAVLDLSAIPIGGLYDISIKVSDGVASTGVNLTSWLIADKKVVTISQNVDPEIDDGEKESRDYNIYYLSGNEGSTGRTKYLFVGDSLSGQSALENFRLALAASVNKLNDSDASEFFSDDYFTVVAAEPVDPDGTSPASIRTGCYDFDENIYCIGEMDRSVFSTMLPDNTLVSILTSIQGRGVNQGSKNIQPIRADDPTRTRNTLMHELGHAHGFMGDEYRTTDDRDVSFYADLNPNTSTEPQAANVKWRYHISDLTNVLGQDTLVCYNYGDGSIGDWDDRGIQVSDCGCFVNLWGPIDSNGDYPFLGKNPECSGVGHFEGNYYGDYDNYRPTFCSIMDSCNSAGYGPVNVETFAVGSLQNQGFYGWDSAGFQTNQTTGEYTGLSLSLDVIYDPAKVTLKWYVDGVEDTSKRDQKSVVFQRPANDAIVFYTAKAEDLTGTIITPDNVMDTEDFYDGLLQSSFYWCEGYINTGDCSYSYDPNPNTYINYDFGYYEGPIGFTWGQNWTKF